MKIPAMKIIMMCPGLLGIKKNIRNDLSLNVDWKKKLNGQAIETHDNCRAAYWPGPGKKNEFPILLAVQKRQSSHRTEFLLYFLE